MTRSIALVIATAGVIAMIPMTVHSQASTTRGWSIGANLNGTSLDAENSESRSGGGLGVRVGYGINRIVTAFLQLDGSAIEIPESVNSQNGISGDWLLSHAEVGARFHFANSLRRWVPYLEVAAGARVVSIEEARVNGQEAGKVNFNGGGITFGGGLSAYISPRVALDVSLKVTGGEFTEVDLGGVALQNLDIEATSVRFGLGFVWWP
ncbi:MAG: outer membrane beta-barrel protein [Gemmatimonadota bacterium]